MSATQTEPGVSVRTLNLLTLLGMITLLAGVFAMARRDTPEPAGARRLSPLDALPAHNAFVATLNLVKLRQSPAGATLAGNGRVLPGVGRLEDVCGFDPTARIRELAIGIPAAGEADAAHDFGIVATGDFSARRIAGCAARVIERRGGTPVRTRLGSFVDLRDRRHAGGEVAVRDGGPVLLGGGSYLREMVDAADEQEPSARRDELHAALRKAVGKNSTLIASWVLSPDWLVRLSGSRLSRLSPLSRVRVVALGVNVSPHVEAHAVIGCAGPRACKEIAALLEDPGRTGIGLLLRRELGTDLTRRVRISTRPHEVHLHLDLTHGEAARLVARALARLGAPARP